MFASIFGEDPSATAAREARNSAFQEMLNTRKQAAEQQRTDNVKLARWNALGNVLTTMVQPLGWGIGGGFSGGTTGGVQRYDDRQYIDSFNRAVKAADDIRNIGSAEAEYRFKMADEDYRRIQSQADAERQQARMLERQERAEQARLERDQKKYDHDLEMLERKNDAKRQLEEYKATHRVTRPGTGLTIEDRILLKELDAYNKDVAVKSATGQPYGTFDEWMKNHGYQIDRLRGASTDKSIDW